MQDARERVGDGDDGDAVDVVDVPFVCEQGVEGCDFADESRARRIVASVVEIGDQDAEDDDAYGGDHQQDAVVLCCEAQALSDAGAKKAECDCAQGEEQDG